MKKNFKILCLMIILSNSLLFAQLADHSRILPDFSKNGDVNNITFSLEGRLVLPVGFSGDYKLTTYGYGGMGEVGYDLDGWLFSLGVGDILFMPGKSGVITQKFNNVFLSTKISKLIGHDMFDFMPSFLDLRPTFGIEANIGRVNSKMAIRNFMGLNYNFSLAAEFTKIEKFIPYIGINCNLLNDRSGLMTMVSASAGVRTTLAKLTGSTPELAALNKGNPGVILKIPQSSFSPDDDRKNDTLKFITKARYDKGASCKSWTLIIKDSRGNVFKNFSGTDSLPSKIIWDGKSDSGEIVQSAASYTAELTLVDTLGNTNSFDVDIDVDIFVIKDGNKLKILVPQIAFDADKATFTSLTREQINNNNRILNQVAAALKKYKKYKVIVEGHANNTTGTEEEEVEDLIPLSQARADAIVVQLVNLGIEKERLSSIGMGGRKPIGTGPDSWKNRRVEFILTK